MTTAPSTEVNRKKNRQRFEAETLDQILAEALVAHVGIVRDGHPVVLPFLCGVGDLGDGLGRRLLLHGSTGGGLFLAAGDDGIPVCATITHIDSLVLATNGLHSSADYRSAVIYGNATVVPQELKWQALRQVIDHLVPGRNDEITDMTAKDLAQTQVLQVPLDHWSVKVRDQGITDSADDGDDHSVWSGRIPLALRAGEVFTSPATIAPVPESVLDFVALRNR
ncbi:MAG TPA: pyridoxamine 5'-phosphate oxidase family protein [Candidatus Lumbricidophila sp.]|nr:pyridoxamine 5'-phosphate oxidase family protein [Candidatus Lumbricidophila sp.]